MSRAALGTLLSDSSSLSTFTAGIAIVPKLFTGIILDTIVWIVFMRKRNALPFITMDDF